MGEPGGRAPASWFSGIVRVTTVDEDQQEVVTDEPSHGEVLWFRFHWKNPFISCARSLSRKQSASRWTGTTLPSCCSASPWPEWIRWPCWDASFTPRKNWCGLRARRNPNEVIKEKETFRERVARHVASFGGSWTFFGSFAMVLIAYASLNLGLAARAWDPNPFILLNPFLYMLAAIHAPVIMMMMMMMMSQNRQDKKNRLRGELDYEVNRRAEAEIQGLAHKINLIGDKIGDVEDLLRNRIKN
jgi:uncharacterized membrane protein